MSNINAAAYENAAQLFFTQNPRNFEKFYSPTLLSAVVAEMQSSLPSVVAARLSFDRLVRTGKLARTDGRTEADDRAEAKAAAQANLEKVISEVNSAPLSRAELEEFSSMSQRDLSAKYYANDGFSEWRVRYDKAAREHLFRIPPRFQEIETPVEKGEVTLSAREYHAIRAADVVRRLRDPHFKMLVDRLIQRGEI